jgi:hypothetical protein
VATDRPNVEIIRLLLASGADRSLPSEIKETPIDWAQKFNNPAVLGAMKLERTNMADRFPAKNATARANLTARGAVERSLPLLQRSAANVFTAGGCVACHAQPVSKDGRRDGTGARLAHR